MAVLGGICHSTAGEPAVLLHRILDCQMHRAAGASRVTHAGPGYALGMCNPHDRIWVTEEGPDPDGEPVRAVVDGIVLDGPRLAEELAQRGVRLERPTCAALVAGAYRAFGLDFMEHVEGELACAVWDDERRRLVLARDPFGSHPLHYHRGGAGVVFSSEIKGVLAAGVVAEADWQSISHLLSLNGVPAPDTLFRGIAKVEPGTLMVFESGEVRSHRYWSSTPQIDPEITEQEAAEELGSRLMAAVRRRMLGTESFSLLSGGMDSSCVVSLATEAGGRPVHAVSIGFEEASHDELDDARAMAQHVGAIHHFDLCRPHALPELIETVVRHQDEPFFDTSAFPSNEAARLAGSLTDKILTGDGPDQLHGGSPHHVHAVESGHFDESGPARLQRAVLGPALRLWRPLLDRLSPVPSFPARVHRNLHRRGQNPIRSFFDVEAYFPELVKRHVCSPELLRHHELCHPYSFPERWFAEAAGTDAVCQVLHADVRLFLPDDLMIKVDRMFRAHGVETLSPFLDRDVARTFLRLPGRLRVPRRQGRAVTKYVLRQITSPRLPPALREKKKQGFAVPLDRWLRERHGDYLREVLLDRRTLGRGIFRPQALRQMVECFLGGRNDYFFANEFAMIGMLTLEIWHRLYID